MTKTLYWCKGNFGVQHTVYATHSRTGRCTAVRQSSSLCRQQRCCCSRLCRRTHTSCCLFGEEILMTTTELNEITSETYTLHILITFIGTNALPSGRKQPTI